MCNEYEDGKCRFKLCYYAHSQDELRAETCLDYYYTKKCTKTDCKRIHSSRLPELPTELTSRFKYKLDGKVYELKRNLERAEEDADREYKKRKQVETKSDELRDSNKKLEEENVKLKQMLHMTMQQLQHASQMVNGLSKLYPGSHLFSPIPFQHSMYNHPAPLPMNVSSSSQFDLPPPPPPQGSAINKDPRVQQ